jgi:glyoxylase-like metal-dependent hydrolase (beta-lactamase superfamily II)
LRKNGWTAKYIINTHSHFDHVLGNEQVSSVTKAKIVQHESSKLDKDIAVRDGQAIDLGKTLLRVFHTPGHSEDSICLVVDEKLVFTGDTLFVGTCGRIDLPGSDPSKMYHSLFDVVCRLDEKLVVYPGHNYGPNATSTIGRERATNYVLQPRTKEQFLELMGAGS